MEMESYWNAMRDIEKERADFLGKIDLAQPSFEEQHQLEVRIPIVVELELWGDSAAAAGHCCTTAEL